LGLLNIYTPQRNVYDINVVFRTPEVSIPSHRDSSDLRPCSTQARTRSRCAANTRSSQDTETTCSGPLVEIRNGEQSITGDVWPQPPRNYEARGSGFCGAIRRSNPGVPPAIESPTLGPADRRQGERLKVSQHVRSCAPPGTSIPRPVHLRPGLTGDPAPGRQSRPLEALVRQEHSNRGRALRELACNRARR
jgi:hypothetical protein